MRHVDRQHSTTDAPWSFYSLKTESRRCSQDLGPLNHMQLNVGRGVDDLVLFTKRHILVRGTCLRTKLPNSFNTMKVARILGTTQKLPWAFTQIYKNTTRVHFAFLFFFSPRHSICLLAWLIHQLWQATVLLPDIDLLSNRAICCYGSWYQSQKWLLSRPITRPWVLGKVLLSNRSPLRIASSHLRTIRTRTRGMSQRPKDFKRYVPVVCIPYLTVFVAWM